MWPPRSSVSTSARRRISETVGAPRRGAGTECGARAGGGAVAGRAGRGAGAGAAWRRRHSGRQAIAAALAGARVVERPRRRSAGHAAGGSAVQSGGATRPDAAGPGATCPDARTGAGSASSACAGAATTAPTLSECGAGQDEDGDRTAEGEPNPTLREADRCHGESPLLKGQLATTRAGFGRRFPRARKIALRVRPLPLIGASRGTLVKAPCSRLQTFTRLRRGPHDHP